MDSIECGQAQNELQGLSSAIFLSLVTLKYMFFKNPALLNPPHHVSALVEQYLPKLYACIHNLFTNISFTIKPPKAFVEHIYMHD